MDMVCWACSDMRHGDTMSIDIAMDMAGARRGDIGMSAHLDIRDWSRTSADGDRPNPPTTADIDIRWWTWPRGIARQDGCPQLSGYGVEPVGPAGLSAP